MTVSSTTDRATFIGNGVTTSFPLPFRFFFDSDIQASLIDNETFETEPLVLGIDYSLEGAGEPELEGSSASVINMLIAAPAVGYSLFVQRVMAMEQPTDIVNQGRFHADIHETVFDRLTMLIQQAALGPSRVIQVQPFDPIPGRLPGYAARAGKVFGFDESGDPVVSSMSLQDMQQQPQIAQQYAQQAAGSALQASDSSAAAQDAADDAEQSKEEAEGIAQSLTGAAVPLFSVMWWPQRSAIPAGYVAADGQELSRLTYPGAWAGIDAGNVPTVADATWNSTPTERGKFSSGDGSTTFRLPDYNGKFAGSLGAVFLRGDGALSAAIAGVIQRDAFQGHWHELKAESGGGGVFTGPNGLTGSSFYTNDNIRNAVTDGVNGTPRTASETRPLNVTGCWVIKLFGAVVNVGSADAAQLASDYANLAAALQTFEARYDSEVDFTIIYPNGGSEASPAAVAINSRYVLPNPFPGHSVLCVAEVMINNEWGVSGRYTEPSIADFVSAAQLNDANIIVQTGITGLSNTSRYSGTPLSATGRAVSLYCRVKVWKVKGAIA